jgi:hypothetical protein
VNFSPSMKSEIGSRIHSQPRLVKVPYACIMAYLLFNYPLATTLIKRTIILVKSTFMQLGLNLSNGVTDTLESSSILIYSELYTKNGARHHIDYMVIKKVSRGSLQNCKLNGKRLMKFKGETKLNQIMKF